MTGTASLALSFLFQRLNWPVTMVRWRAARQIRSLMQNEETREAATNGLFEFLDKCRTESEVSAILSLVLLLEPGARPAKDALIDRIRRPSILSEYLLQKLYGAGMGGWIAAHSGTPPESFEAGDYFEEHKTAHIPPVFLHNLEELETRTGLPFVRQWSFEWACVRDETQFLYTRYPYYFDAFSEVRSGIVGNYLQRQSEVFRSAYLRTFAYAVSEWRMPQSRALREVLELLPAIGGMFDLEPAQRPEWLGDFPDLCAPKDIDLEALVRAKMEQPLGNHRVVSFVTPFSSAIAEYGDLHVGAYLVTPDFSLPPDGRLFEPLDLVIANSSIDLNGPVPKTTVADMVRPGTSGSSLSICGSLFPIPHGYWQSDYFSVGLPTIAAYCLPGDAEFVVADGRIEQRVGNAALATTTIWNDGWTPRYPKGGSTRCGAMAVLNKGLFNELPGKLGRKLAWFAEVRIWRRERDFDEFEIDERRCFYFDS